MVGSHSSSGTSSGVVLRHRAIVFASCACLIEEWGCGYGSSILQSAAKLGQQVVFCTRIASDFRSPYVTSVVVHWAFLIRKKRLYFRRFGGRKYRITMFFKTYRQKLHETFFLKNTRDSWSGFRDEAAQLLSTTVKLYWWNLSWFSVFDFMNNEICRW